MTQQEAMNNILENWVRVNKNLQIVKETMPPNSMMQHSMEFDINQTEQILKSHGFVYRIVTEQKEGEYQVNYIFRKKKAISMSKIHMNWISKHIGWNWLTTNMKEIEL